MSLTSLTSFNGYPKQHCNLYRPERYRELLTSIAKPVIARGYGKSYGDAALNENGNLILMERLNRFVTFDPEDGILTAEAGVTLQEILSLVIPQGWFLPVTPGTQYVTLGGCLATDVHGKNHHRAGTIGTHTLWIELITAQGDIIRCSALENADTFWATVGGMGLTGLIGTVCLQLQRCSTPYLVVYYHSKSDLASTLEALSDPRMEDEYSVAWLDALATHQQLGRSILMTGHHAQPTELPSSLQKYSPNTIEKKNLTVPCYFPNWVLNRSVAKAFQQFYWSTQKQKKSPFITSYQQYFYPLDAIQHWNRLYGKRGFVQYQCVIPHQNADQGIKQILLHLQATAYPAFLGVLKNFGNENLGLLSFPKKGFTLALDIPILDQGLFAVLQQLDEIVLAHEGRIYLAKDARLDPEIFRLMYPNYSAWLKIKNKLDPQHVFSSSLSRRLELC